MNELLNQLQEFRKILCICPCCGEMVRVSDLRLRLKGTTIKTWLDEYQKNKQYIEKKEERFYEMEEELREVAREKGRKEAEEVFNKSILPSFKALKLDPFDVKPILNPVDFVVFKGMNKNGVVSDIVFLSKEYKISSLHLIRCQIQKAIAQKNYEWQVARIDENGKIVFE